jgi:hypothetical protein
VFILEHCLTSKSFAAVREAFSNAYPHKEIPNITTKHRLVTLRRIALKRVDACLGGGGGHFQHLL